MNFFDKFPEFITGGTTGVDGKRLNHRYRAIIENQRDAFSNAKVLDLASHDGRWSLAALDAGADKQETLVGMPTIHGLGIMLDHLGFVGEFIDWEELGLPDWEGVEDYRDGGRFTMLIRTE